MAPRRPAAAGGVSLLADEAVAQLERDGQVENGKTSPWVKVSSDHGKTLAALASKLRLAPSSRIRPESHALRKHPIRSAPWDREDDELLAMDD